MCISTWARAGGAPANDEDEGICKIGEYALTTRHTMARGQSARSCGPQRRRTVHGWAMQPRPAAQICVLRGMQW